MTDLLSFTWSRDPGGYIFQTEIPKPLPPGTQSTILSDRGPRRVLVGVSGKAEDYSPLEGNVALFKEIADTEQTETGVLLFASRYGPLTDPPQDFDEWRRAIQNMRQTVEFAFAGDTGQFTEAWNKSAAQIARAHLRFARRGAHGLSLQLVPRSLLDAAMIQLAHARVGGHRMLVCDNCNKSFIVGTGTSRRVTSKFCGTICRKAWHRRQHRG